MFQSQTGSQALSDLFLFVRSVLLMLFQSQTGSQALSDGATRGYASCHECRFNPKREARPSQTWARVHSPVHRGSFNPKREARPSQTRLTLVDMEALRKFQSQTGSQALSDNHHVEGGHDPDDVSIPNGKPGPLRPHHTCRTQRRTHSFNPKREARPSQTPFTSLH